MSKTLLEIEGLEVHLGGTAALDGVSMQVGMPGRITGLIGPNGAGKTTLIDVLSGFLSPSAGTIEFAGEPIGGLSPSARAGRGLVRTFQSLQLFEDMSVRENLLAASRPVRGVGDLLRSWHRTRESEEQRVEEALAAIGIEALAERAPGEISHGQRNLVSVARALVCEPRMLLLDEPAAGLDSEESARLGEHLRRVAAHDIALLVVDHDMGLLMSVCDWLWAMDRGRVIAHGPPQDVQADPAVVSAYLGDPVSHVVAVEHSDV